MMQQAMVGILALGAAAGALVGCKTSEPGVKNTLGTYTTRVPAEPPEIADAAARALEDLDLVIITNSATALDGLVVGRTARDMKIQIDIKDEGDVSQVGIRVGSFGDEATSQTILNKIRQNLQARE